MPKWMPYVLGSLLATGAIAAPVLQYRVPYGTEKRFREVTAGKFYRCGQMSADAFRDKLRAHGIKTVVNLQDEQPDPLLSDGFWDRPYVRESEVCAAENTQYRFLSFADDRGLLPRNQASSVNRPRVIDDFLAICDDPANYPILIHCKAGLHRTGALTAIYRMEYEGWTAAEAMRELRSNGYGDRKCTTANDYIYEYIYLYQPGLRNPRPEDHQ